MASRIFRNVLVNGSYKKLVRSSRLCENSCGKQQQNNNSSTSRAKSTISDSGNSDFLQSPYPDVDIPDIPLSEFIFQNIGKWHNKIAAECSVTGRKYTYENVLLKSRNLGKAFKQKLKLGKGDVVAIFLPNVPEYTIVFNAGFMTGIILTTLNPLYTIEEISRQLIDSDSKAIITLNSMFDTAKSAAKLAKKNVPIITIKTESSESTERGSIDFHELINAEYEKEDFVFPNTSDIAIMPYSSGTTGLPKGVEITQKNIVSNIVQMLKNDITLPTTETFQDVTPIILPMFHIYGLTTLTLFPLSRGLKLVTLPRFTPDLFVSVLKDHRPGLLFVVPPIVNFMTTSPLMKKEYFEPIRVVLSGAAPLGALDEEKFLKTAQKDISMLQGYGLTETSPGVTAVFNERKKLFKKMGTVGEPLPNTKVKIVAPDDTTGKHCKSFESGELWVKGPQVMKGYHNKPEQTAETMAGEWFKTGDLAHYDEDNFIYVTDRLKELIKVKGFQVAPAELEELLRNHPEVADAAVIGIPHQNYGEVPRAYVVPKCKGIKIGVEKLNEYLSPKLTDYKLLRGGVAVLDAIPKNAAGKILRKNLKKMYETENK